MEVSSEAVQNLGMYRREPKSNKERAREHRNRKKAYYQQLENKINMLEEQVKNLTEENLFLRDKIYRNEYLKDTISTTSESIEKIAEESKIVSPVRIFKPLPTELRLTMIDKTKTMINDFGTERIRLLNNPFRTILENAIPLEMKVLISCFDNFSVNKFVSIFQEKKRNKKHKYIFKESDNKSDLEIALMKLDFSDQLIEKWKVLGKNCKNIHLKLKLLMQKLVKVRNQIFKSLSSLNKIFNESGMAELNEMQDLESLIEMCRIVKESKLIDYHILWKIPRKAEILEEYNENELSN